MDGKQLFDALITGQGMDAILFEPTGSDHLADRPVGMLREKPMAENSKESAEDYGPPEPELLDARTTYLLMNSGVNNIMVGICDFQWLHSVTLDEIWQHLIFAGNCDDALYFLKNMLLDSEVKDDLRAEAAQELEEMLTKSNELLTWLQERVTIPLFDDADLEGALNICQNLPLVLKVLITIGETQLL